MLEVFGIPIGSVSQLITAIVSVSAFFWALMKFGLGWRGQSLDAEGLLRKQTLDAEALLRTHFAERLVAMEERLERSEKSHTDCLDDRDKLRARVRELEDHLEGVYRMLVQTSAEKVIEMGTPTFPEHIIELARRTVKYTHTKPPKGSHH